MVEINARGAIVFASGMEEKTISRHFSPGEKGTLLEYVLDSVWTVADELIVVFSREPKLSLVEAISPFAAKVLTVRTQKPLDAIIDAFQASRSELCLLATERVPLLKPNVTLSLFENAQGHDLAIPRWKSGKLEPMLAVYRRNALLKLVNMWKKPFTKSPERDLTELIEQLFAVKQVPIERDLKDLDPELDSFLFVDSEKKLSLARSKASVKAKKGKKRSGRLPRRLA
jgi:molybdenum cofactor guanylyltransferase